MSDLLVRGTSADGTLRAFAAVTTDLVNEARRVHNTYPVASAALGRLLTAAAIMGAADLKDERDSLTVQIKGEGEIKDLVAVSDCKSRVRGYISDPYIDRPLNSKGKLDVGGAIGGGFLSVVRDLGLKEPYTGQVPLVSGEIAEDITYYYAKSQQIPTSVALGVLVDTDNSVIAAGGFMLQMLPGSTDEMAQRLEKTLDGLEPVTSMINGGMTAEDVLFRVTDGFDMLMSNDMIKPEYKCTCSRERMERGLTSIGKDEIRAIMDEQGEAELTCRFCNSRYLFTMSDLEEIYKKAR